ncbi:MAG: hypothetical protein RM338_00115 [Nostoc sp. DedQUE12a]|nr:hypothetical protein [Nostoc sp. DedQUE12a]
MQVAQTVIYRVLLGALHTQQGHSIAVPQKKNFYELVIYYALKLLTVNSQDKKTPYIKRTIAS